MAISQKCEYALRAMLELAAARGEGRGALKSADIAAAQAIPPRFLEVILHQLKRGGFVESRRGAAGGHMLARSPKTISVGDVVRYVDGPIGPTACVRNGSAEPCELAEGCVFQPLWRSAKRAR